MLATLARHAGVPGIGNGRMVEDDGEGLILLLDSRPWCLRISRRTFLRKRGVKRARAMNLMLV